MKAKALLFIRAATLVLAVGWIYQPAFHGGWLWDDDANITGNSLMRDPRALWKIWFAPQSLDFYPLQTTVEWMQWHLWGMNPLGYHLTNIGLQLLNVFLLWSLLRKLGLRFAWLGALLFAVHPMTLESVAWISELKNTMSLAFLLLAMGAWVDWDNGKVETDGCGRGSYLLSLLCFLAAMLSKSAVVMFPVVLLLYAWWRCGRITRKDLAATLPFFAISITLGLVTIWLQQHRAIGAEHVVLIGGVLSRLALSGLSAAFYFWKFLTPVGLMPIYPHWSIDPPSALQLLPFLTICALLWLLWKTRRRGILFGVGVFLVNLAPVSGLVAAAFMSFTWVMDHLAYVSLLGLIGLVAAGVEMAEGKIREAKTFPLSVFHFAIFLLIAALAVESHAYAATFSSGKRFWTSAVERNPDAWCGHYNLGLILIDDGRFPEAIAHLEKAVQLNPDYADSYNNLGIALSDTGRWTEAIAQFKETVRLEPGFARAHYNLGNAFMHFGNFPDAIASYEEARRHSPDNPDYDYNLGSALTREGRAKAAIPVYEHALRLNPDNALVHVNLGIILAGMGRFADAIAHYQEALRLNPGLPKAHNDLGTALASTGHMEEATAQFEEAVRLDPDFPEARLNLAHALRLSGRTGEARAQLEAVSRLRANEPLPQPQPGP